MRNLEQVRQERNDLLGKIEAFKKDGNENRTKEERLERNKNFGKMVDDLQILNERVKQLEVIDRAEKDKEMEEEFSVRKVPSNGGGDLKLRKATWNDPITEDSVVPSLKNLQRRDKLVFQRFEDPDALNTRELVKAHRKYAGERLFFKYLAAGADNEKLRLSQKELDLFHDHQKRAQSTTANIGTDADGGYLVPTVTEAAIVHQMAFIGPFAGPSGGAGRWQMYANGEPRKINVNTSRKTAKAKYVDEGEDIVAQKAAWSQVTLNFHNISNLMPWTIQAQQDSASNLESELRMEMSESFGRFLNDELTSQGGNQQSNATKIRSVVNNLLVGQTITGANGYNVNKYGVDDGAILPSEIIRAKYSIDKAYRGTPDFKMHCSDRAMMIMEQVRDNEGRFLYHRPQEGGSLMVHGLSAITNNGFVAPSGSSGSTTGPIHSVIGAFNKFRIGHVRGMYVTVFRELFMQSLQLGLMMYWRVGSVMTDNFAFSGIKYKQL